MMRSAPISPHGTSLPLWHVSVAAAIAGCGSETAFAMGAAVAVAAAATVVGRVFHAARLRSITSLTMLQDHPTPNFLADPAGQRIPLLATDPEETPLDRYRLREKMQLSNALRALRHVLWRPVVIQVSGPSGAGKSHTIEQVVAGMKTSVPVLDWIPHGPLPRFRRGINIISVTAPDPQAATSQIRSRGIQPDVVIHFYAKPLSVQQIAEYGCIPLVEIGVGASTLTFLRSPGDFESSAADVHKITVHFREDPIRAALLFIHRRHPSSDLRGGQSAFYYPAYAKPAYDCAVEWYRRLAEHVGMSEADLVPLIAFPLLAAKDGSMFRSSVNGNPYPTPRRAVNGTRILFLAYVLDHQQHGGNIAAQMDRVNPQDFHYLSREVQTFVTIPADGKHSELNDQDFAETIVAQLNAQIDRRHLPEVWQQAVEYLAQPFPV